MKLKYYDYKTDQIQCKDCNWKGLGSEAIMGEVYGQLFGLDCPNCHEEVAYVPFPTEKETLMHGTEKEIESINARNKFLDRMGKSLLTSVKQLPKLDGEQMVFTSKFISKGDDYYLQILYEDQLIWEEMTGYENYERFIQLGKLLKKKYKSKMIDIIPEENHVYFYGDSSFGYEKVNEFRESLKPKQE